MIRKDEKTAVIEANRTHPTDTGSPEVQIAILTARINELTDHLQQATTGVVVLLVDLQVLGQLVDAGG